MTTLPDAPEWLQLWGGLHDGLLITGAWPDRTNPPASILMPPRTAVPEWAQRRGVKPPTPDPEQAPLCYVLDVAADGLPCRDDLGRLRYRLRERDGRG